MKEAEIEDSETSYKLPYQSRQNIYPSKNTGTEEQRAHAKDIQKWNQQNLGLTKSQKWKKMEEVKNNCDIWVWHLNWLCC